MPDLLRDELQTALAGRYAIERELGGGGMSRVFVAEELELGRQVVIKALAPELSEGLSAERFAREVKLAARLQQANIVPLLSAGVADGVPWYSMPFVRGQSLRARLATGETIPLGDAIGIARDVARALAFSHAEGVVHRDIKPENILLSGGTAVVTDFGIAKALSVSRTAPGTSDSRGITLVGSSIGTPGYMAPEQVAGDAAMDHRADIYAWAVVAWELLAGRHPFAHATTPQAIITAHMTEVPRDVRALRPEVPPALAALLERCLAKDPSQRPATAAEVLHALDVVSTPASLASGAGSGGGSTRGRRSQVLAGVAFVALTATGIVTWWGRRESHPGASTAKTLVVMPFDNLGPSSDAFFADGVSEEIASRLGQVPGIRVIGRASAARLKNSNRTPEDAAREFGAAYVLTGTVRWDRPSGAESSDATVRITPALMRVAGGERLWGEPITEKMTDVFKVQADIAERVATALSVSLGAATRSSLHRADTQDPAAREATLLGWSLVSRRGNANIRQALSLFQRAIARDSNYARAWAGLAEAQSVGDAYGVADLDSSGAAARRAVALDSLSPEAWLALATTLSSTVHPHAGLDAVSRALLLDPSNAAAHSRRGMNLLLLGRLDEAYAAFQTSTQLDPLVAVYYIRLAFVDVAMGRIDSVRAHVRRSVDVDPGNGATQMYGALAYLEAGLTKEAVDLCTSSLPPEDRSHCRALETIADPGRRAEAVRIVDSWAGPEVPSAFRDLPLRTSLYAHLGATEKAFALLPALLSRRSGNLFVYASSPWMAPLKLDPRWQSIVVPALNR